MIYLFVGLVVYLFLNSFMLGRIIGEGKLDDEPYLNFGIGVIVLLFGVFIWIIEFLVEKIPRGWYRNKFTFKLKIIWHLIFGGDFVKNDDPVKVNLSLIQVDYVLDGYYFWDKLKEKEGWFSDKQNCMACFQPIDKVSKVNECLCVDCSKKYFV